MNTKEKFSTRIIQNSDIYSKLHLGLFKLIRLSFVMVLIMVTSCDNNDDVNDLMNCPEVSLVIQEDMNTKGRVTVTATSSITNGAMYTWNVTDASGTHEPTGNADGSLNWDLEDGETEFCLNIQTPDCANGKATCVSHNYTSAGSVNCTDVMSQLVSEPSMAYRTFTFKDNYMYFTQGKTISFSSERGVRIYKLDITDENAVPIQVISVSDNIGGWVGDLTFKGDKLYASVWDSLLFAKVYEIDTSVANPSLVEVLDGRAMASKVVKGNYMYMAGLFRTKIYRMDLTTSTPSLTDYFDLGRKQIRHLRIKGDELYMVIWAGNTSAISKINLNDANLKETIVLSNIKEQIHDMTFNGDTLYLLLERNFGDGNWIGALDVADASPKIQKVQHNFNFEINNLAFYKDEFYMIGYKDENSPREIVKVPNCAL